MKPRRSLDTFTRRQFLLGLTVFYLLLHCLFHWLAGVRFLDFPLYCFAHFADTELLKTRLLETCFYLHVQPPLYNFVVGSVLKLADVYACEIFHIAFLLNGLGLYLILIALLRGLGASRLFAVMLVTLLAVGPQWVFFEHFLLYTFQSATLLALAALFLFHFYKDRRPYMGWGFFMTLALLGAIRSMYHLSFYAVIALAVIAMPPIPRRRLILMAVLPGLMLSSFYFKNLYLFDHFSVFSFLGKSPWIKTVGSLPWAERQRLAEEGKISKVSLVERFWAIEYYPPEIQNTPGYEDVPVLRQTKKSDGGEVNYNHIAQIAICDNYMKDSLYVLRHYPKTYLVSSVWAAFRYVCPVGVAHEGLHSYEDVYNRIVYLRVQAQLGRLWKPLTGFADTIYFTLLLGLPCVLGLGFLFTLLPRKCGIQISPEQRATMLFICFCMLFVAAASIVIELNETNRYRYETEPITWVAAGFVMIHLRTAWRHWRRHD